MKWKLWKKEEPPKGSLFLLEWDGSWTKAFYWRGKVEIAWLGESHVLNPEELKNKYWLSIPRIPER